MLNKLINLAKLHSSPESAFLMGFIYAIIGILVAFFLFPSYIGIVSVFFTSMALMPVISRLIEELALREGREKQVKEGNITLTELQLRGKKISVKGLWLDHKHLIQVYLYSFFGAFMLFALMIFILPQENGNYDGLMKITITKGNQEILVSDHYVFGEQFEAYERISGSTGDAVGATEVMGKAADSCFLGDCEKLDFFVGIIKNNLWVLIVTFLVSLIYGFGAMFIITWNASVWGIVFANRSIELAPLAGKNPIVFFGLLLLTVLPHTALEALTYFAAAMSGGIASQGIAKEEFESERFERILIQAFILMLLSLLLLVLAAFVETYVINAIDEMIPKY
ncbi:stage II sporulation protein M [Candidatus Micrarchaeota archaeon]|nr:stage II sporulation protein M [Candidatus Micrarchaeota archaeon]MBU2476128.1 stage II sporulation protein M [Candidatus Micrarchaeota archaeon]